MPAGKEFLYVRLQDEGGGEEADSFSKNESSLVSGPGYTRPSLQATLQLMGCKPRHAYKISERVFRKLRERLKGERLLRQRGAPTKLQESQQGAEELHQEDSSLHAYTSNGPPGFTGNRMKMYHFSEFAISSTTALRPDESVAFSPDKVSISEPRPVQTEFHDMEPEEGQKSQEGLEVDGGSASVVVLPRSQFYDAVCMALADYRYVGPNQQADLDLACRVYERKTSVIVLLCGTSGCGKSTLASLLASQLGISTVVSTDSIRHMMRSFISQSDNPLLYASTYHAGEFLDPAAMAAAKAAKKNKKVAGYASLAVPHQPTKPEAKGKVKAVEEEEAGGLSGKNLAVMGFKAQSELVVDHLDRLLSIWEARKESAIVEGVHLSLNFVMPLMKKHPTLIPFTVYISNETKHLERFAVRARYMTLDPARNKYVKYIRNIRTIQDYIIKRAEKHLVPKVNNTNVDKSVAAIHATVFACLRRRELRKEPLWDPSTNTVWPIAEEYNAQRGSTNLSSKGMFQMIQRQGSNSSLIRLVSVSGRVAGTWSVPEHASRNLVAPVAEIEGFTSNGGGKCRSCSSEDNESACTPVCTAASPINVCFGTFGLSKWANQEVTDGQSNADRNGACSYGTSGGRWENDPLAHFFPSSSSGEREREELTHWIPEPAGCSTSADAGRGGVTGVAEPGTSAVAAAAAAAAAGASAAQANGMANGKTLDDVSASELPNKQLRQAVSASESDEEEEEDEEKGTDLGESDDGLAIPVGRPATDEEEVGSVAESETQACSEEDLVSGEESGPRSLRWFGRAEDSVVGFEIDNKEGGLLGSRRDSSGMKRTSSTGSDSFGKRQMSGQVGQRLYLRVTGRMHMERLNAPVHGTKSAHLGTLKEGEDERGGDADVESEEEREVCGK